MTWLKQIQQVFVHPEYLAAGGGVALLIVALHVWSERRRHERKGRLVSPALAVKSGLEADGISRWAVPLFAVLCGLGLFTALARPRWGATTENAKRQGTDIAIVLDTSASMNATDVTPSRFVLARQAALSLLSKLAEDRVALIACEGEAQTLVPLTLDTAAAGLFLEALEPGVGTLPGTSVAAGLRTVASLFAGAPPGSRQCVFISDGEDLEGGVEDAIALAKSEGITVHTVYAGPVNAKGAPVPNVDVAGRMTGYKTDESGKPVLSKPDPELLRKIAAETGGSFSIVSPGRTDLDGVAGELDKAGRRPLAESLLTSQIERFQFPLGAAAIALAFVLLGRPPLPGRLRRGAAGIALLLLSGSTLLAQTPPASVAPEAPEPPPSPTPAPTFWQKLKSGPPFHTARGEAKEGIAALDSKKNDEAVKHFGQQKSLAPADPRGAYNLGTALSRQGKTEEAIANFDEARKDPRTAVARDAAYNQGNLLLSNSKFDEAVRAYRESLKASPGASDAAWNYELALRLAEMKKEQEKKQQQNQQNQKNQDQKKPTPTPSPEEQKKQQKEKEEREFEQKANMSRDKAEQLLSVIANADRDEQKKQMAERRKERRVSRDW